MQRAGRTSDDYLSDLIHFRGINQDPGAGLRLEDLEQAAKAIASANAKFRLPRDNDLVIAVHPLYTGPLALLMLVIGFAFHCQTSFGFDKCLLNVALAALLE